MRKKAIVMQTIPTPIIVFVIFFVYQLIVEIKDIVLIKSMLTTGDKKSKTVSEFRTLNNITIRQFAREGKILGCCFNNKIYINEAIFDKEKTLYMTLQHEFLHYKKKHWAKRVVMKVVFCSIPLLALVAGWGITIPVFIAFAYFFGHKINMFEKEADNYAKDQLLKKLANE